MNCTSIKDPFLGNILLKDSFIFWVTFSIPGFLSGAPCKDIFLAHHWKFITIKVSQSKWAISLHGFSK